MKVENIEKPTTKFIATKLFWVGVVGTYILAGLLLNRLETNASYEELRSSSLIPNDQSGKNSGGFAFAVLGKACPITAIFSPAISLMENGLNG